MSAGPGHFGERRYWKILLQVRGSRLLPGAIDITGKKALMSVLLPKPVQYRLKEISASGSEKWSNWNDEGSEDGSLLIQVCRHRLGSRPIIQAKSTSVQQVTIKGEGGCPPP